MTGVFWGEVVTSADTLKETLRCFIATRDMTTEPRIVKDFLSSVTIRRAVTTSGNTCCFFWGAEYPEEDWYLLRPVFVQFTEYVIDSDICLSPIGRFFLDFIRDNKKCTEPI